MIQYQLRAARAHTHKRTHAPTLKAAVVMMKQPPARMRTTPAESERKHVRVSIETPRAAPPTFVGAPVTSPKR